ncbi:sensor histidine kinase [Ferrovibrio sp.]|uniref:sensor histidine kinase n=1 Tax=Ferrovibrio sp. TaxID=1917215 RepID=UPI003D110571
MAMPAFFHVADTGEPDMRPRWMGHRVAPLLGSAALTAVCGLIAHVLELLLPIDHLSVVFLPAVLASAIAWGLGPSLFAAVLAVAVSSFFFYKPFYNLHIGEPQELVDLVVFTAVAVVASHLAAFARRHALEARRREADLADLQRFSRRLADTADPAGVGQVIVEHLGGAAKPAYLFEPQRGSLEPIASSTAAQQQPLPFEEARKAWSDALASGAARVQADVGPWRFHFLRAGGRAIGLLARRRDDLGAIGETDYGAALLDQAATALERAQLALAMENARVAKHAERLREAVIGAISHDLQTPLAAIIGAASTLESFGSLVDEPQRVELLGTIREESERLGRNFSKLFDMSQIGAGELVPKLERLELADIVDAVLRHTARVLRAHHVEVSLPVDLPMLHLDALMLEHALENLLENASKYAAAGTSVSLTARQETEAGRERVVIEIADQGVGIRADEIERIFEPFYRAGRSGDGLEPRPAGKGLGLMISRAFVEANRGTLTASSPGPGQGSIFRISLPVPPAEPALEA